MLAVAAVSCPIPKPAPPGRDRVLLTHTTLVALTPLIPLPFVDDMAKSRLQRRMVRLLAQPYDLLLRPDDLALLADDAPTNLVGGIVKGLVLTPLRSVLRKAFIVLAGNKMAEVASTCYHRGWLADRAFARSFCAPEGPHSARAVRTAIDEVMATVPVSSSPITAALKEGFGKSRTALERLVRTLRRRLGALRGEPQQAEVEQAVDAAAADATTDDTTARGLDGIVSHLRRALSEVPAAHFDELEQRLCDKLG